MNRYSVITIVAVFVIASPIVISAINVAGVERLEYGWGSSTDEFSFFWLSSGGQMKVCNTMPVWGGFESFDLEIFYQNELIGTYSVESVSIDPMSSGLYDGTFRSDHWNTAHHTLMALDFEINSGTTSIDPAQFVVETSVNAPFMGFVPHSVTSSMTGHDFDTLMRMNISSCN